MSFKDKPSRSLKTKVKNLILSNSGMSVYGVKISPMGIATVVGVICLLVFMTGGSSNSAKIESDTVSMRELLSVAIQAAEAGGDKVNEVRNMDNIGQQSKGETREGVDDPLTLGDQYSHEEIVGTIKKAYGDSIFIFSEEKDSHNLDMSSIKQPSYDLGSRISAIIGSADEVVKKEDVTIWVDPLDATKEFTERLLNYVTTMVCVAVKGKPVIGVIHKPFKQAGDPLRTVFGWNGVGANIQDKTIGREAEIENTIIVSRSHKGDVEEAVKAQLGESSFVIGAGGAGYKAEELFGYPSDNDAKRTPAAYVHTTLIKKWDICAGDAILRTLGGKQTKLNGEDIDYDHHGDPKNEGGLVAALHNQEKYVQAFQSYVKPAGK